VTEPAPPEAPEGRGPSSPAEDAARPARRGLIGPFSGRQLVTVLVVVVLAGIGLSLATTPLGPPANGGGPPIPGATPYIVGPVVEGLRPGDRAPELEFTRDDGTAFRLTDLDGNPVRLSDLEGRLVWVNFWASWCPPCQAETPVMREMDETYRDQGLSIVAIAVQETTVDDVAAYADRYELEYTIAFDASGDVFRRYRVFALPTQFFIGPDGRILQVVNGPLFEEAARQRIEAWLPAE
jgi:thiol-disulfide isomerase/thioredoxin